MPRKLAESLVRQEAGGLVEYKVGDSVLIKSEPPAKKPFIGVIKEIYEPEGGAQLMQVNWYYRPSEVVGGRKFFHGKDELFESDHTDVCDVTALMRHCEVLSLDDYLAAEQLSKDTFFTRYFYKASREEFQPDRVMVYCTCELPFNPDLPMVMCQQCEEWYHLACLGLKERPQGFVCEQCEGAGRQQGQQAGQPPGKRPKLERQH